MLWMSRGAESDLLRDVTEDLSVEIKDQGLEIKG